MSQENRDQFPVIGADTLAEMASYPYGHRAGDFITSGTILATIEAAEKAARKDTLDALKELLGEHESCQIDWAAFSRSSPDYDPNYRPLFSPLTSKTREIVGGRTPLEPQGEKTIDVGDGTGGLYVHGDYASIARVQTWRESHLLRSLLEKKD